MSEQTSMIILLIEPGQYAREMEIGNDLKSMQAIVGGYIEVIYPFPEPVAIVCNEEGKLHGLAPNRALYGEDGKLYDILCGTFFVCGLAGDNFGSLSPEFMQQMKERFLSPEQLINIGGELISVRVPPVAVKEKQRGHAHER